MEVNVKGAAAIVRAVPRTKVREYADYWKQLTPNNSEALYRRWIFAWASVNSGVAANLDLYKYMQRYPVGFSNSLSVSDLQRRLRRAAKGGMFNIRARGLHKFDADFIKHPELWSRRRGESYLNARGRISNRAIGLGLAKSAFGLELVHPLHCRVVCIDRHMLRLYGITHTHKTTPAVYNAIEMHWVRECERRNMPPALVRHFWWDRRRDPPQDNTRYWSYVFE